MKNIIFVLFAFALSSCTSHATHAPTDVETRSYFAGGNGLSIENAVTFPSAKSSPEGVALERRWITERYRGSRKLLQRALEANGKMYDQITILTPDAKNIEIYFEMTNWMGFPRE